jgi:glycosyltransferase involved in cell wall biosynthesis
MKQEKHVCTFSDSSIEEIKICLVSPVPPPYGGIAHWTQMILRHAAEVEGLELEVINTAPTWRSIHNTGIIVRTLGGTMQLVRDCSLLVKTLSRKKMDVIHLTTSGNLALFRDLAVLFLAKFFGVRLVYHIRFGRMAEIINRRSLEWLLVRTVMRKVSAVIVIDRMTFDAVRNTEPGVKLVLIPNCIDPSMLPLAVPSKQGIRTALFLGWVIPNKGVEELVKAWVRLDPLGWRLDIVGPYNKSYRDTLLAARTPANLRFLGQLPHDEAMKRMAACDLFVFPSYTEGFPNAVLEAMALGRPIIATDVGAIPEMLSDGAGILVRIRDIDGLVKEMARVMGSDEMRSRMGNVAYNKAHELYSLNTIFQSYLHIWRTVSCE